MSSLACQFCGGELSGRQRTTCAECRKKSRHRLSGFARLTVEGREDRNDARRLARRDMTPDERRVSRGKKAIAERRTLGIDGEGRRGRYFLLAAAASDGTSWHTWRTGGLSSRECFAFLTSLPPTSEYVKWGFSFGYDVNMMLGDVPFEKLLRLYNTGRLRWLDFRLEWYPGKMFRVTRYRWDRAARRQTEQQTGSCTIWDMYPWQATSFVKWLRESKLAPESEIAAMEAMKLRRSDFDPETEREQITAYCLEECRLLAKGTERLHEMLMDQDVRVSTFHSPATVSKHLMKRNGVAGCMAPQPEGLKALFDRAYFGGRAELVQAGPVEGPLFYYDIRSAYPTAMLGLPCWAHGRWSHCDYSGGDWSLLRVRWAPRRADPHPLWGPFPVRPRTGSLKWPTRGEGWFWASEVKGVTHLSSVEVLECWTWVQDCDHQPFGYLKDLYEERLTLKAAGDRREYVNKIALNASYGATAEHRKRGAQREPRWREPAWAGMITAATRGAVGGQLGSSVVMVATDAVVSREPLAVNLGSQLGEWEGENFERGLFVGPGVYFLWRDGGWKTFKSRGISAADIKPEGILAEWAANGRNGFYRYERSRFVGLGSALHRTAGLPPPEDGETVWRQFVDGPVVRYLTLEPRREWVSEDPWDGRSRAPSPKTVSDASLSDRMRMWKLKAAITREKDPMRRLLLTDALVAMSTDDDHERSIFFDSDMP